jgi:hypothetical protein
MKRFIMGFAFGLLVFGFSNVVSHFANSSPVGRTERVVVYGFPIAFWEEGGFPASKGNSTTLPSQVTSLLQGCAAPGLVYFWPGKRSMKSHQRLSPVAERGV